MKINNFFCLTLIILLLGGCNTYTPPPLVEKPSQNASPTQKKIISIPSNWTKNGKVYTGVKTTFFLPPDYSVSEQTAGEPLIFGPIVSFTETWRHSTSIEVEGTEDEWLNNKQKAVNSYTGGSRREWYRANILRDKEKILKVREHSEPVSYLEIVVQKNDKKETHYVFVNNSIAHVIKPNGSVPKNSPILKNIEIILYSLHSERVNCSGPVDLDVQLPDTPYCPGAENYWENPNQYEKWKVK